MKTSKINIAFRILKDTLKNALCKKADVYYVVEAVDWVVRWEGKYITDLLKTEQRFNARLTTSKHGIKDSIIIIGSMHPLFKKGKLDLPKGNRVISTWYHVNPKDPRNKLLKELGKKVDLIHTSCNLTKTKLMAAGVPRHKIKVIPEGVDCERFTIAADKNEIRNRLGLPQDKMIIGSFQKDGVGWGEGNEPKTIKGPDTLIKVIEKLSKDFDLHILLTGPSRGYVKNNLDRLGVKYTHSFLEDFLDIVPYYQALDAYLVTSREEGGPKAILESMATGVPIISTRVGMAPDVIINEHNGMICEVDDIDSLYAGTKKVLNDKSLRNRLVINGRKTAEEHDWKIIVKRYKDELIAPLEG